MCESSFSYLSTIKCFFKLTFRFVIEFGGCVVWIVDTAIFRKHADVYHVMCSVPTVPRVVLGNTVPLAQTVSTVLPARTLSLEVPWSQIASALQAWAARMEAHVNRVLLALSPTLIQPIQPKLLPRVHHAPAAGRLRGRVQQCAPSTARATTLPILSTSTRPLRSRR